jgi:hypothetical protein
MENVALMNRLDTKFTFSVDALPVVLERVIPHYLILTTNDLRSHRYETLYFDTPALQHYTNHHNGIYARHKIRYRKYVDSGLCFFEIKTKNNQGRTIKQRIRRSDISSDIRGETQQFVRQTVPFFTNDVNPVLWVYFSRLTLVSKHSLERLTIDMDLSYRTAASSISFTGLVIAEMKRDRSVTRSPFVQAMRERRLHEGSISKYCLGIMSLYPKAKRNRFKERFRQIASFLREAPACHHGLSFSE